MTIRLKDLGYQVPYRALYLWEYVSLTRSSEADSRSVLSSSTPSSSRSRRRSTAPTSPRPFRCELDHGGCWADISTIRNLLVAHFIKRELESMFVHSFSRPSVPLSFVFRK